MRKYISTPILIIALFTTSFGYFVSCRHSDDLTPPPSASDIKRGTDVIKITEGWAFDKTHSNVMWETAYMGSAAMLTGRFNMFGFRSLNFDESNPANTNFEAWVRLNTVNTGEPGRDGTCILGSLGTALGKVDETENLAVLKSKSVEFSPTDKGYIVKADLIFKGVTKEVIAKMTYAGKTRMEAATPFDLAGLYIEFQFFAKTDYAVVSNNIADKVMVKSNAQFKK
jgi:polyisoprenoid-binding protein YceI